MDKNHKKMGFVSLVTFLIILSCLPIASSNSIQRLNIENLDLNTLSNDKELHLLRVEHYLDLVAEESQGVFFVKYAFPPDYAYQAPILLEIFNDTDADILNYKIEDDKDNLNKVVNFTINGIPNNQHKLIHFTAWVLVENHDFSNLPESKPFPNVSKLPEDTKKWLVQTNVTQKDSILIRSTAKILKGLNDDMIRFAKRVAPYIKYHKFLSFLLQLKLGVFFSQDALTTLFINGENVGRSHLSCAFFRSQNVPARVLLVNNDQGFWTQMHYMVEYYVPDYGWVLLDTTKGETPYDTSRQVVNRICFPEDENDTKTDYIFKHMKGEECWMWLSTENVRPYYVDCDQASKSQMFSEKIISTPTIVSDACFDWTRYCFRKYQQFLGTNLSIENQICFEDAVFFQKSAINCFKSDDVLGYYYFVQRASEEYDKISV